MKSEPLDRVHFDADKLMETYPPKWRHQSKQAVFDLVCSSEYPFQGQIIYTRWPKMQLPAIIATHNQLQIRLGVFAYADSTRSSCVEWHMNFADTDLFVAYGSPLLAQDELQVVEHPILGSLREALRLMGKSAATVDARNNPTPITISGVQRRCAIDTCPNPKSGRPAGLYGNAFARASIKNVMAATRLISPPVISNILAMTAPPGGIGNYSYDEIACITTAAYTGFLAARRVSSELAGALSRTQINTGFWGCGAFGGNRTLMTMLQALAADLAEVDLIFYATDQAGVSVAKNAYQRYRQMAMATPSVPEILQMLALEKFHWGESDGN